MEMEAVKNEELNETTPAEGCEVPECVEENEAAPEATEENKAAPEAVKRPYTLRKLKDRDLFLLLKILRKIGLKEFKDAFNREADEEEGKKTLENIGVEVILNIAEKLIDRIGVVEDELYTLYADISGIPAEEIKEMEFGTLPLMIFDSFSEAMNTSFFKVLSRLL